MNLHFDISPASWSRAGRWFLLFIVVACLFHLFSGRAALTITIKEGNNPGVDLSDLDVVGLTASGRQFDFKDEKNTWVARGTFLHQIFIAQRREKTTQPISLFVQTPLMERPIVIKPTDWHFSPNNPNHGIVFLTPLFPSTVPCGGAVPFFSKPLVNWPGFEGGIISGLIYWPYWLFFPMLLIVVDELRHTDERSLKKRGTAALFLFMVVLTTGGLALLNTAIALGYQPDIDQLKAAAMEKYIYNFFLLPDPVPMTAYVLSIVLLPFLGFGSFFLGQRLLGKAQAEGAPGVNRFFGLAFTLLLLLLLPTWDWWFQPVQRYVVECSLLRTIWVPVAAAFLFYFWTSHPGKIRSLLTAVGGVLSVLGAVFLFGARIFNENCLPEPHHFVCIYYSVTQEMVGKTWLVDNISLYGGYALFLEPIFRVVGYGIASFTFAMSVLSVLSCMLIALSLREVVRDRALYWLGLAVILFLINFDQYPWIYLESFWVGSTPSELAMQQPYFARVPLRAIFPTGVLWLILYWLRHRSAWTYYVLFVAVFLAPFWNLDSGLPLVVLWPAVLLYDAVLDFSADRNGRKLFRTLGFHTAAMLLFLIGVVSLLSASIYIRSGRPPDFTLLTYFHRSHMIAGFFAAPMNALNASLFALSAYLIGMVYAIYCLGMGRNTLRARIVWTLVLSGLALFPLYVNRALMQSLLLVGFPAVMLTLHFLERWQWTMYRQLRSHRLGFAVPGVLLFYFVLGNGAAVFTENVPGLAKALKTHLTLLQSPDNTIVYRSETRYSRDYPAGSIRKNAEFLRARTKPAESVLVLSDNFDGYYYGTSGTRSVLDVPSSVEWNTFQMIDTVTEFLQANENVKVFAERSNMPPQNFRADIAAKIGKILDDLYEVESQAEADGTLALYRKKQEK